MPLLNIFYAEKALKKMPSPPALAGRGSAAGGSFCYSILVYLKL
jgi:hypothetical protein